jgi:hypothetical protein
MRSVFSNRQCVHVWASRSQEHGKGPSIFFDGPTIYSYGRHFPMARFVDTPQGMVCLVSRRTYSPTTSKHQSYVRCAIPSYVYTFHVPEIGCPHAEALAQFVEDRDASILAASRARVNVAQHLEAAEEAVRWHNLYAACFGQDARIDMPEDIREAMAGALMQSRERAAADRQQAQEREALRNAEYAEREARWLAGDDVSLWYVGDMPTRLRLSRDGETIETSRGAEVPRSVAPRLWVLAQSCRAAQHPWTPTGAERVGSFALREVTAQGDLVIGCHTLTFAELERFAAVLDLCVGAPTA